MIFRARGTISLGVVSLCAASLCKASVGSRVCVRACPKRESNPHAVAGIHLRGVRVCQFRHSGTSTKTAKLRYAPASHPLVPSIAPYCRGQTKASSFGCRLRRYYAVSTTTPCVLRGGHGRQWRHSAHGDLFHTTAAECRQADPCSGPAFSMLTPMLVQYVVGLCCLRHDPDAVDVTVGDMVRSPEFHVLEYVPTGETFARAALADWGDSSSKMLAIVFGPASRTVGIHTIALEPKHRHAIRRLKIPLPPPSKS